MARVCLSCMMGSHPAPCIDVERVSLTFGSLLLMPWAQDSGVHTGSPKLLPCTQSCRQAWPTPFELLREDGEPGVCEEAPQHSGGRASSLHAQWQLCRAIPQTLPKCWLAGRSPATHPLPAASAGSSTSASEVAQAGLAGNYVSWSCFTCGSSWSSF